MSLARAFTTRRTRADKLGTAFLGRTASHRTPASSIKHQISGPINLISSTNVLAYEAPDIVGTTPTPLVQADRSVSSGSLSSSRSSGEHSDASSASRRSHETFTDASSVDGSPCSAEPNHLSCYFKPSVYTDTPSGSDSLTRSPRASIDAPAIPQRSPTHSKTAHFRVNRQRSITRMQSPPTAAHEFAIRESTDFFCPEPSHPFGKELEQLSEVVEEFGGVIRDAEAEADQVFMEAHGLGHFCATDYVMEIAEMFSAAFDDGEYSPTEEVAYI